MGKGEGLGEGVGEGKGQELGDPENLDLINRDPNDINDHLRVDFEDVLAEPDGAHSSDCTWQLSYRCFTGSKLCCYRCLTCFCGCFIALCWGCEFACITFWHVWQVTPMLRVFTINCGCAQKFWGTCVQCCLAPVTETCGLCLSRIQLFKGDRFKGSDEDPL